MLSYLSLHDISKSDPATERFTIIMDLRDLGVSDAYCKSDSLGFTQCRIYVYAGPFGNNERTGRKEQAGWLL
mgnify:FL=1